MNILLIGCGKMGGAMLRQWATNEANKFTVADPAATVQVRGERWPVEARTATPPERAAWWPQVLDAYDGYAAYASRTEREIPVVFLERPAARRG